MNPLLKKSIGFLKKAFLVFVVYAVIVGLFSHFINKDKPQIARDPVQESRKEIYAKINDPELKKTFQGKLAIGVFRFMACTTAGEACTNNPNDGNANFSKSMFGYISKLFALPYSNQPASGTYWIASTLQKAGFIPQSYASEGIGFASIQPIMGLWKIFRDVSYMLMVLVLVAMGFMIMFRVKINPQTVISVENSLPKIAVSMLLITFSFPIAGFLIDFMYIIIALLISLLSKSGNAVYYDTNLMQNAFLTAGPGKIFDALMNNPLSKPFLSTSNPIGFLFFFGWQFQSIMGWGLRAVLDIIVGIVVMLFSPQILTWIGLDKMPDWLSNIAGATVSLGKLTNVLNPLVNVPFAMFVFALGALVLPPLFIGILFFFTILLVWGRIFFLLFSSYLQILLLIIFSPIFIMLDLIPGSKMGFAQWFKNLAGELIAFPTVIVIFLISHIIASSVSFGWGGTGAESLFTPPFLTGIDPSTLATLISIGLTLLIPDLIKAIKQGIGAKGVGLDVGLGSFFGGVGAAWAGVGAGAGFASSLTQMPVIGGFIRAQMQEGKPMAGVLGKLMPPQQGDIMAQKLVDLGVLKKQS